MQERVLHHPKIEVLWNTGIEEVLGENKVEGLKLKTQKKGKEIRELQVDGLFLAIGHKPATEVFKNHVELDAKGYVVTSQQIAIEKQKLEMGDEKQKEVHTSHYSISDFSSLIPQFNYDFPSITSVEGVFAAGDCVDFHYRQAATASGMGVAAALETERWLAEFLV